MAETGAQESKWLDYMLYENPGRGWVASQGDDAGTGALQDRSRTTEPTPRIARIAMIQRKRVLYFGVASIVSRAAFPLRGAQFAYLTPRKDDQDPIRH